VLHPVTTGQGHDLMAGGARVMAPGYAGDGKDKAQTLARNGGDQAVSLVESPDWYVQYQAEEPAEPTEMITEVGDEGDASPRTSSDTTPTD
jgi:hypothetical protein